MIDKMIVENVVVWGMEAGMVTELMLDDCVFVLRQTEQKLMRKAEDEKELVVPKQEEDKNVVVSPPEVPVFFKPERKVYTRGIKICYLEKWIRKGVFKVFVLEDFLKVFPKQRGNYRLNNHIGGLIKRRVVAQLGKERFRVLIR